MACTGSNVSNVDKNACITAMACHGGNTPNAYSVLDGDCITDAVCEAMQDHFAQHDGICMECTGNTPTPNLATGLCDGDSDNCPEHANAEQGDIDKDGMGDHCDDSDNDGIVDALDVDDDNDGLIEIASYAELHNMRHNFAGTSYDDEEADDTTGDAGSTLGAPDEATANCGTATNSVYLCGYELVADIDFSDDGDGNPIDQNGDTAGNFEPIGSDQSGSRFTAQLEGNGHSISNLDIDRIASAAAADDHTNDAGLFAACGSTGIRNLTLAQPTIKGRRRVDALCGTTSGTRISNAHIAGGAIQGDSSSTFRAYLGGLVGWATSGRITGSRASANVSGSGGANWNAMGGLVGRTHGGRITGSRASGNVSDGGGGNDSMGGLVGLLETSAVRDSLSLGSVCDGVITGESCAAGDGNDNVGILIGSFSSADARTEAYNCLGTGLARGHSGDHIGFWGNSDTGADSADHLNMHITNNRFDTEASGVTATVGSFSNLFSVTAADLTGIVGADTAATQSATAYDSTWLATRWLFAAGAYPRLLYFNFDPDNPTTENPSSETTIDVCETITDNDPLEDEGEADKPDCGDVLEAWPRAQE